MSKAEKFKGKQGRFDVEFVGINLVFRNVLVKEVDRNGGHDWSMLQRRGNNTTWLTTPGYLIDPELGDVQELLYTRIDPEQPMFINGFGKLSKITKHTRLNLPAEIYSIDNYPGGMRLQYTSNLIGADEHKLIERIQFTKVG